MSFARKKTVCGKEANGGVVQVKFSFLLSKVPSSAVQEVQALLVGSLESIRYSTPATVVVE